MQSQVIPGLSIEAKNVSRTFTGGIQAVDNVSFSIADGEFVSLLGQSGCGKSTLLRLIAGLDRPTAGTISITQNAKRAYVFQDAHLLPWRNVIRNVALPLELAGVSAAQRKEKAMAAIEQVGLTDAADRYPAQLSGGMRMRVSLARAVITDPHILLMDEPFAALDEITRQRLDEQLRSLWINRKMTVLFVTHSTAEAAFVANRAIVMSPRPGRIILDRAIQLPFDRTSTLRGTPEFAKQTHDLYAALSDKELPH